MSDFHFKKKYGQNFLKDNKVVKRIVSSSEITKDDLVIEVGPGRGILTKELAINAREVISYEIDNDLVNDLIEIKNKYSNISFIFDDFLKRDIESDIKDFEYKKLYFISNVPYYITTPILMKIMESKLSFHKIIMMIQKEVGERFSAKPKSRSYSSITVYLNYYYDIKKEFDVNRNEFIPVPNVDSCIVSLTKKENIKPLKNEKLFFNIVRDSFQFKRKNIKNNLKSYNLEIIEKVLKKYGYDLTVRAEELPLDIFIDISNELEM